MWGGPKVMVGLDLGTSSSEFSYALTSGLGELHSPCGRPEGGPSSDHPFPKLPTSLLYTSQRNPSGDGQITYKLMNWGSLARTSYSLQCRELADLEREAQRVKQKPGTSKFRPKHYLVEQFNMMLLHDSKEKEASNLKAETKREPHAYKKSSLGRTISAWLGRTRGTDEGNTSDRLYTRLCENEQFVQHTEADSSRETMMAGLPSSCVLPPKIGVENVIVGYLYKLADFALHHLAWTSGSELTKSTVQWCLTVPASLDNRDKEKIHKCAREAGMILGDFIDGMDELASPHPLTILLESEAAALACSQWQASQEDPGLMEGDEFMVVDMGGSKVEVAVHKLLDDEGLNLMQMTTSSKGLCGGSAVDMNFVIYLSQKVPRYNDCARQHPGVRVEILRKWEEIKCTFDGSPSWRSVELELPLTLVDANRSTSLLPNWDNAQDKLEITFADMKLFFDAVVAEVVELVRIHMRPNIKKVITVGGFSSSQYVMRTLREEFGQQVSHIISPPDPISAISRGAVIFGLHSKTALAPMKCCRTYVTKIMHSGRYGNDRELAVEGTLYRRDGFQTIIKKGDTLRLRQRVSGAWITVTTGSDSLTVAMYSSDHSDPKYIAASMRFEGTFRLDHPVDCMYQRVQVSLEVGRSCLLATARVVDSCEGDQTVSLHHTIPLSYSRK